MNGHSAHEGQNGPPNGISIKREGQQRTEARSSRRHDPRYLDVIRERPIRVTVRVLVPVKEHPKFNFVGKLLGPKGNSMKRLQEDTMTKMAVLGRGSMRDKAKEEDLRASNDPKYTHLAEDLHVEITSFAPPAEAHARIAYSLAEIRRYLVPDNNDEIRKEQIREMEYITDERPQVKALRETMSPSPSTGGSIAGDRPNPPLTPPADHHPNDLPESRLPSIFHMRASRSAPPIHNRLPPRGMPPLIRKIPAPPNLPHPPAKRRVLSILDKAKIAMDHSYGIHDDPYDHSDYLYEDYPEYCPDEYPDIYRHDSYEGAASRWGAAIHKPYYPTLERPARRRTPYSRSK